MTAETYALEQTCAHESTSWDTVSRSQVPWSDEVKELQPEARAI